MTTNTADILDPFFYPWYGINFFFALWVLSKLLQALMGRCSPRKTLSLLDEGKKRNCITYVVQIIVTTVALAAQIYGGWEILFQWSDTSSSSQIKWMGMSLQLITILYVWELIYRNAIGWPLLLHHIVTLVLIQLTVVSFYETRQMFYIRGGTLLGFHATTEQLSFVALYCYRTNALKGKALSRLFIFSSFQTFLFKTIATAGSLYIYADGISNGLFYGGWGTFWKVLYIPLLLALMFAQVYACRILYILGKKVGQGSITEEPKLNMSNIEISQTTADADEFAMTEPEKSLHDTEIEV